MEIRFNGLEALGKKLSHIKNMDAAKQIVRLNGAELNQKMVRNAHFVKGYSTGQTRRSISLEIQDGGMTASVKPNTHYSPYLEYGTRKMAAQPFVKPAFNAQKEIFKDDMSKLVK
ncbi:MULTISPECIES: HK97-gp10 family putative phage morphogenesis protein [unclassified Facklamia]|uniref:HK97-gp10 family putative phage morphogenesis protein n=1 Tax=Facklamia sp. 252 TaxID=2678501 RepID=UPI001F085AAB|nr:MULTISPECIES: HK97-gp10 family putative phage morphogenesis protein [unclassified Facklamia]